MGKCKSLNVNVNTSDFCTKIVTFLKILPVNLRNFSAKLVNLPLDQTPVFDERCYQYQEIQVVIPTSMDQTVIA